MNSLFDEVDLFIIFQDNDSTTVTIRLLHTTGLTPS